VGAGARPAPAGDEARSLNAQQYQAVITPFMPLPLGEYWRGWRATSLPPSYGRNPESPSPRSGQYKVTKLECQIKPEIQMSKVVLSFKHLDCTCHLGFGIWISDLDIRICLGFSACDSGFEAEPLWHLFGMMKGAASRCPLYFSSATEHRSYVTVWGLAACRSTRKRFGYLIEEAGYPITQVGESSKPQCR
jgi:hypothetical protein